MDCVLNFNYVYCASFELNATYEHGKKRKNDKSCEISPHRTDSSDSAAGAYGAEDLNSKKCSEKPHH